MSLLVKLRILNVACTNYAAASGGVRKSFFSFPFFFFGCKFAALQYWDRLCTMKMSFPVEFSPPPPPLPPIISSVFLSAYWWWCLSPSLPLCPSLSLSLLFLSLLSLSLSLLLLLLSLSISFLDLLSALLSLPFSYLTRQYAQHVQCKSNATGISLFSLTRHSLKPGSTLLCDNRNYMGIVCWRRNFFGLNFLVEVLCNFLWEKHCLFPFSHCFFS